MSIAVRGSSLFVVCFFHGGRHSKLDVALLMPLLDEMEAQLGTQSGAERAVLRRLTNTADVVAALFPLLRRCALAWVRVDEHSGFFFLSALPFL